MRQAKIARDPRTAFLVGALEAVFQIDLTTCPDCGGTLKFIAAIMERCGRGTDLDPSGPPSGAARLSSTARASTGSAVG